MERLVVSAGKEVVLVMHSYGGIIGSEAVNGLEKPGERRRVEWFMPCS